jgi:hypothetical protein
MTVSPLPQASDKDMAELSAAVYDADRQTVGKWTRVVDPALRLLPNGIGPTSTPDATSGFRAAVFSDGETYVLAFGGTERETRDWLTNLGQAVGLNTAQFGQAACFAKECKMNFGENLVMTGHSLGGGLAAIGAAVTNSPAVTFNPSGLHDNTLKRLGIDPTAFREAAEQGLIRKYVVRGEILDRLQTALPVPHAPGHRIEVDGGGRNTFSKHRIGVAIEGVDAQLKSRRVFVSEHLLGEAPSPAELAATFRNKAAKDGVREHPALENAYKMLGALEAKAAAMGKEAGDSFRVLARENLATRIEKGSSIPPLPSAERLGPIKSAALHSNTPKFSGPER